MAQKRMIDKKISVSEQVSNMSREAQCLYTWCIPHADDIGLLPYSLKTLKATIVPLWNMDIERFSHTWGELGNQELIESFGYNGEKYWKIKNFTAYQTLKKDRNPQTILKIQLKKNPEESWKLLESIGIQMEDNEFQLDTEVKRSEEKNIYAKNKSSPSPSKKKNPKDDTTPLNLDDYISKMRSSPQRHIQIIGEYADQIRPKFTTRGQWSVFTSRNLRAAKELSPFSDKQISDAFKKVEKNIKSEKNPKGYITKWGLETLIKFIHEN